MPSDAEGWGGAVGGAYAHNFTMGKVPFYNFDKVHVAVDAIKDWGKNVLKVGRALLDSCFEMS